jgi:predicted glycoside hydrolase/deacetylase ChbG (UPF0249 family)
MSETDFMQQLGDLAKRWHDQDRTDLGLRYETGKLLNDFFGPPNRRQTYGKGTMKKAAQKLRRTEVELSQLRRFASFFKSFPDFQKKHPKVTNWTKVRELLASLRATAGGKTPVDRKKADTLRLRKLTARLSAITAAIGEMKITPTQAGFEELRAQLQALVQAVPDCLRSDTDALKTSDPEAA